jgi:hypothetical protein
MTDVSGAAGAVVHHELLAERLRKLLSKDARADVGSSARRERYDQAYRLGRIAFRRRRGRDRKACPRQRDDGGSETNAACGNGRSHEKLR